MKKLFALLALGLVVLLAACNNETTFEPVTIDGFAVRIETRIEVYSAVIDRQGNITEDEYLNGDEVAELLADLEIELPVVDAEEFTFVLTTTLDNEVVEIEQLQINGDKVTAFESITFDGIGIFTYELVLDGEVVETITVTITADEEVGMLVADVDVAEFVFINLIEVDVTEEVQAAILAEWNEWVAQAYEDGYEYLVNENGEYVRVVIYVPTPNEVEENTNAENTTETTTNNNTNNQETINNNSTSDNNQNNQSSNTTENTNQNQNNQNNQTNNDTSTNNNNSNNENNTTTNTPPPPPACAPIDIAAMRRHGEANGLIHNSNLPSNGTGHVLAFQSANGTCDSFDTVAFHLSLLAAGREFYIRLESVGGNFNVWLYR